MVYHTRLLGVFVPSNRRVPKAKERNVHTVPVVEAPPFIKERRNELDRRIVLYARLSDNQIKGMLRKRGIGLPGRRTRAHWIKALEGAVTAQDMETYEAWKSGAKVQMRLQRTPLPPSPPSTVPRDNYEARFQEVQRRRELMLYSRYTSDPKRLSFLGLPPEIRNMVYNLALCEDEAWRNGLHVTYSPTRDVLMPRYYVYYGRLVAEDIALSTFEMLSALSKEVRREVRSYFYGHIHFHLKGACPTKMSTNNFIHHFLRKIGPDGRATIRELKTCLDCGHRNGWDIDFGMNGLKDLTLMLKSITMCQSLTFISLEVAVSQIFTPDIDPLKAHLIRGESLVSQALETFCSTLTSMKSHPCVHIEKRLGPGDEWVQLDDRDDQVFLRFAFSGIRERMLWAAFDERVKNIAHFETSDEVANRIANTQVWYQGRVVERVVNGDEEIVDYAEWLEWFNNNEKEHEELKEELKEEQQ